MSYINLIQEYYQKENIFPLPTYEFKKSGSDHNPVWIATIELFDFSRFIGKESKIKNQAKLFAAEIAYDYLYNKYILPQNKSINIDYSNLKSLIVVDLENCPQGIKLKSTNDLAIIGFLSHNHSLYEKIPLPGINTFIIKSTRKDAADQYMVFKLSELIIKYYDDFIQNNTKIIILSKDNFAGLLAEIINQDYPNLSAMHITSLRDLMIS